MSNDQSNLNTPTAHGGGVPKAERITQVQDCYPASWSFGAFGREYRRTWNAKPGEAIPKLKGNDQR
jgi:hypothetical protein